MLDPAIREPIAARKGLKLFAHVAIGTPMGILPWDWARCLKEVLKPVKHDGSHSCIVLCTCYDDKFGEIVK
jgi:hypothetical protein